MYNITSIASNITSAPTQSLALMNNDLGGWIIAFMLYASTYLFFVLAKNYADAKDSDALLYASLTSTVMGLMLFLISVTDVAKLITWFQLLPLIVITGIMIVLNFANRNF